MKKIEIEKTQDQLDDLQDKIVSFIIHKGDLFDTKTQTMVELYTRIKDIQKTLTKIAKYLDN